VAEVGEEAGRVGDDADALPGEDVVAVLGEDDHAGNDVA
jgi:hypothetical protein